MVGKQLAALEHRAHIGNARGINVCHRFAAVDLRQQALEQRAAPTLAANPGDFDLRINFIEPLNESVDIALVPSGVNR